MKTKFIINPIAGTGKQLDITNKIKKLLEKDRFNFDIDITERPNHATELSEKAIKEFRSLKLLNQKFQLIF